jgi:CRP/FNR family transcriptional regulator
MTRTGNNIGSAVDVYPFSRLISSDEIPLFGALSKKEKALLEKTRIALNFNKGEIIHKHGAHAANIFFVARGVVKSYMEISNKNLIIAIIPAGNFFGLTSLSVGKVYHYGTKALTDATIYSYDIGTVKAILRGNPHFATGITNMLNAQLVALYDRFFSLTQKQLPGRMADILLCLAREVYHTNSFELFLSRKDLAELTGISTESTIRILKDFKEDRIIALSNKYLRILKPEKLEKISATG